MVNIEQKIPRTSGEYRKQEPQISCIGDGSAAKCLNTEV